jgi:hypothetical protein
MIAVAAVMCDAPISVHAVQFLLGRAEDFTKKRLVSGLVDW